MTAKKSTKTGKNFREGGGRIFLAGQNIYPCLLVKIEMYTPFKDLWAGFDNDLPSEWESWLRFRRDDPPTDQEVLKVCRMY